MCKQKKEKRKLWWIRRRLKAFFSIFFFFFFFFFFSGYVFEISMSYARKLMQPKNKVLRALGSKIKYEIAIGLNGKVWLKCDKIQNIVAATNVIYNSEFLAEGQTEKEVVDKVLKRMRK